MVKSVNHYRVLDRNWTLAQRIQSIEDLLTVIKYCLGNRGYDEEECESLSSGLSVFFKPNKYDILVIAYPANYVTDIPKQDERTNKLLASIKAFNGKGLKYNSPESCKQKYKVGRFEPKEVRFAESALWSKGQSVIVKMAGKQKPIGLPDTITAEKIANLTPQGYFDDKLSVESIVLKHLKSMNPCEVYRLLKGKTHLGSNELNRLIYKLNQNEKA